jgi:hypothetical protein
LEERNDDQLQMIFAETHSHVIELMTGLPLPHLRARGHCDEIQVD